MNDQLNADVEYLTGLVQGSNRHGITRDDLATCFEMSNWDITAWKARFRSALRYLTSNRLAVKVGDRYFSAPKRECDAHCGADITGRRSDQRYCSAGCRRIDQATLRRRRPKQPEKGGV